ncbi:hypothetical protein O181_065198 [Austropuccinia psidii MF-1]|uniref:Tc1-like transposase DDE domain-containing protein n=1 Tax=Austropuccinia psidii MF-1 TaxID=1389203 RepID=A0A9Q3EP99_9BASI|nr:hypothetical protein [Austropuccinia psidii MF-1]
MTVNHRSGRRSFKVWGALYGAIQSELVFLPPGQHLAVNFISNVYEPGLLPFYDELIDAGMAENYDQLTLMEDGAPIHTAQTMEELKAAVNAAWEEIPFEHLDNVLVSMPHRMQAVVNARGAPVRW